MNPRHRFLVLLAFACLLSLARTAIAQPTSPSHRMPDGTDLSPESAETRLAQRLGHAQEAKDFDQVIDKLAKSIKLDNLSPEDRKQLLDLAAKQIKANQYKDKPLNLKETDLAKLLDKHPELQKELEKTKLNPEELKALANVAKQQETGKGVNWDNPEVAKAIQKVLDGNKTEMPPKDQKMVEDYLKNMGLPPVDVGKPVPNGGSNHPPTPPNGGPPIGTPTHAPALPSPPGSSQTAPGNPPVPTNAGQPFEKPSANPLPPQPSWWSKQLVKVFNHIEVDESSKETLSNVLDLQELAKKTGDAPPTPSVSPSLPDLGQYVPTETVNNASSFFGNFKMPSLPDIGPIVGPSSPMADVGGGSVGGMGGMFNVLIVALILVVAGVVIAKVLASRNGVAAAGDKAANLGGWPVQPSAIRTRADLVKCFEYLAVLLLGSGARTRHHLELAAEIGRQAPPVADAHQAAAAQTLARLYEIARYTPENETLLPDDLAAARRELSYLAGAASA